MSTLEAEITEALRTLDPEEARSLGRVIHEVLMHHRVTPPVVALEGGAMDANGYPLGHFERLVGSWADLAVLLPDDPPPDPVPDASRLAYCQ